MTTVPLVTGRLPAELQAPLRGVRSPAGTTHPGPRGGSAGRWETPGYKDLCAVGQEHSKLQGR